MEGIPEGVGARSFDPDELVAQIGRMNILSVSGGRIKVFTLSGEAVGIELPVSSGYKVRVWLDASDTYIVQRVWREVLKGEQTDVYCDEVGEVVYAAGMYQNVEFGAHKGAMAHA